MKTRRRSEVGVIVAIIVLVTFASQTAVVSAPAPDVSWAGDAETVRALQDLYDATKQARESQLVIYGRYADLFRPVWELFRRRYPEVTIVGKVLPGAGTVSVVQAEVSSGRNVGDVLMQGLETVEVAADAGLLQPYAPSNMDGLVFGVGFQDRQRRFITHFGDIFGLLYNTNRMSPNDLPKTLEDLTNPKYKGFVIDNPSAGTVSAFCWMALLYSKKLNVDWMKGIKANATIVQDATPYYAQITTGQIAMMPWVGHSRYLTLKAAGAPVGFVATPGMAFVILGANGIIKGAPHPNAAKLLQTWILTPEAQNAIVERGRSISLLSGMSYPAGWPDPHALNTAVPQIPPGRVHKTLEEFLALAKPIFP